MNAAGGPPLWDVPCVVCGGGAMRAVCSAAEIAAQQAYLPRFHRRRLKGEATDEALQERACFTQDYATSIVRCAGCGLVLRDPRPSAEAISALYAGDSYGRERLLEIYSAQVALFRPKARFLRRWLRPGARVVEVGSFAGGFLRAGREQGWAMLGVDPGEAVAAFCREQGFDVIPSPLESAGLSPGSADAVAIWNTLDQLPDPAPALDAARSLLRPGGLLALRVPNGEFFTLASGALRRTRHSSVANWLLDAMAWNNMLAFPYLYGYSVPSLDRLLARCGFARRLARPDTLVRLSDEQTKPWAALEERAVKGAMLAAARVKAIRGSSRFALAPWLDVYYTRS